MPSPELERFSLTFIIPTVWLGYTLKAYLIARSDWAQFSSDTNLTTSEFSAIQYRHIGSSL